MFLGAKELQFLVQWVLVKSTAPEENGGWLLSTNFPPLQERVDFKLKPQAIKMELQNLKLILLV